MNGNSRLNKAKKDKKDEFYTQLSDIENELDHYTKHFKNKTVLCNCDDPGVSAFFHHFTSNFETYGLQNLIVSCFKSKQAGLFSKNNSEKAFWLEYNGERNNDKVPNLDEIKVHYFKGDGDFRSDECIELLKKADIICTNPPFSLFREYIAQLFQYKKKFLIIGNQTVIARANVFKYIRQDKLWLGYGFNGGVAHFITDYKDEANAGDHKPGLIRVPGVQWFTNLEISKRNKNLTLTKKYNPEEYPQYENYKNVINVGRSKNIPIKETYNGVIGVPITFLNHYNPKQFTILGIDYDVKQGLLPELINPDWKGKLDVGYLDGKRMYSRIFIKHK